AINTVSNQDQFENVTVDKTPVLTVINDEDDNNPDTPDVPTDGDKPILIITGSTVEEIESGISTGEKVLGTVEISISNGKFFTEDLNITLSTGQVVTIKAGETTTGPINVETNRIDDYYKQGTTTYDVSIQEVSNSKIDITGKTATITINDDVDPIGIEITATATAPKIIDVNTEFNDLTGVKISATDTDGNLKNISVVTGTNHDGFGVEGNTTGSGASSELGNLGNGKSEKLIFEFDKDINSLDVAFAWRHNGETARITFINDGNIVGYAEVKGGGSNTKAKVNYYTPDGELIRSVEAQGGTDRVDLSYTFELVNNDGSLGTFDQVEFTAPNHDDDYLINKITYKEVLNPEIIDVSADNGSVTFDVQLQHPPQGNATAKIEVNGVIYNNVVINATGRATLTVDGKDLGDLSNVVIKVLEINGGNYEKVNSVEKTFDFTPVLKSTDDSMITNEDETYTLKVTDFGEVSVNTKEFKITELPNLESGKLYLLVKEGETIIDKEGNISVATQDTKIEIFENQIIKLADVGAGKVIFEPKINSDIDGSFKFEVGDGNGKFSDEYTTVIKIIAVADAPIVSIDVTKIESSSNSEELIVKSGSITYDITNILANKGSYVEVKNVGNNTETAAQNILVNENLDSNDFLKTSSNNNIIVINGDISGGAKIEPMGGNDFIAILGDLINGTINDSSGIDTLYLDKSSSYYSWTVNAHSGDTGMDGTITQYADEAHTQIVGTLYINNIDGIIFADGHTVGSVEVISTPSTTVDYEVDISAALVDLDGSETLTVTITNVPTGATLSSDTYTLTDNGDNTWSVTIPAGTKSITDTITMSVPETKTDNINLGITARATETNDNNDGLNYKESSDLANVVSPFDVKLGSANTLVTQVSTSTTQGAISKPARLEDIENVNTTVIGDTVTTYENMNLAHYSNSGNFNDVIEVNGNSNYIETRGGNDTINVDGNQNGTIDAGEGNNRIDIDGNAGTIYVGNNDDSIRIGSNANSSIDLREGTNIIDVLGNSNSIYSGSGNDTIIVDGSVNGVISSGYGADRIDIGGNVSGMIDSNDGDDVVTIGGTTHSSVYLGGGNDILEITGNADQNIDAGTGNDTIAVKGHVNGYIDLAAGGDTLYTSDYVNGIIFAGEGNDSVILGGYIKNDVRGGSGADSIELTKYSKIDWDTNKDGVKDKVQEFENIKFSDGTIIGNLSAFSSSMTTYEYPVVVSILNNDLDSETITEVKVSFENLPIDGKIYQNGVELIPNNGEYTLNANDLTNIKISSSEQILDESGFKINVCATSTESNGGNIAIKNLNTLFIGDEDNDDTIDFSTAINNKTDIDVVDIKGTNVNTKLKIDIEDLVADTDKELIIKGEFEGKVDLNDGNDGQKSWENSGTENLDGSTYNVYIGTGVNSTVKLLIEDDIDINPDI
ncbi:MAG: hypothetical protein H6630_05405, partial [Arcobacter sp.]|nr:hypothetical protein [Arcobacter sp.]